ncbi:MAG: hypothetical protein DRI34_00995 [Deltaproteobacteria bacterium]|nr:MAG: hypothetical protein DRI34_00995 [Deltaproteobacteria bacterium]
MSEPLSWLALLLLLLLAWQLLIGAWARRLRRVRYGEQVYFARTADDWRLALHYYHPGQRRWREPLLLCHGLGANRYNFDLSDETSLARYLAQRGFSVYSLELRGAGLSRPAGPEATPFAATCFDDYLERDLAAALARLREIEPGNDFFWLGHSMGGLLGLAWAGRGLEPRPRGVVAVGSPVDFAAAAQARGLPALLRLAGLMRQVPLRPLARQLLPLVGAPPFLSRLVTCRGQMGRQALRLSMVNLSENMAGALARQLLDWHRQGGFRSRDGQRDYFAGLEAVGQSLLVVGAEADRLAPPGSVTPAYQRAGSGDKQIRILGRDHGDEHDYGHGDLLLGRHAPEEIYPLLGEWLEQRATPLETEG